MTDTRTYTVWSGESSQVVDAINARTAVKVARDRWRWRGHGNVEIEKVVVNATGEIVDVELWR